MMVSVLPDATTFQRLGLTNAESKVYLALLELGMTTAGPVIQKSRLQNSVVHLALRSLVEKGLVSFILKGGRRSYQATHPNRLLGILDAQEESIETMRTQIKESLPALLALQHPQGRQEAEVYIGFNGLKNVLYTLIQDAKPGDEYLFLNYHTQEPEHYAMVYEFYKEFAKERARRGIIAKGIAPTHARKMFEGRDLKNIQFVDIPFPANITIFHDAVVLEPAWKDTMVVFLIRSADLAKGFRAFWNSMWQSGRALSRR